MRKKNSSIWMMMALVLVLILSACGQSAANTAADGGDQAHTSSEAKSKTSNNSEVTLDTEAGAENEMVSYQSDAGEVQVPKNPKRIVDLTAFSTGFFVALDAPVVGAMSGAMNNKYIQQQLAAQGTVDLGEQAPTAEQLLALKPDLFIVYTGTEGVDKLSQIAPVVQIEYGKLNYKDLMLEMGKLTNKEEAAKAWITKWESQINELKPKVTAAVGNRTVSILNPYDKGLFVFGHNYGRGGEIIYDEFGLKAPAKAQAEAIDSGTGWASISIEVLPEYAGDIIFTSPWSGDKSDSKKVYENKLWKNLPAVKANHVFQLDPKSDTYNDPMSLEGELQFITDSLLSASK
ncbi:ABC transporter substrate-binding protein [Paenibacillus barcinonensis]|uniref:ABC transporter substrate-binding protein n=1 Tax=Paenibacillus barcinonensis TaxID=198119 RepID=A0A2V4VT70_PAEBA|nr:ABC transporter substrate-binding protein [Paenibacillus barcinonensis]PYE47940.1 iron complex transport system substrate-binding protein [Paenibacillus barcinonensis]QKS55065.1 ABC transporter substrate-binding protein [Paenibacillus barcinonensis]